MANRPKPRLVAATAAAVVVHDPQTDKPSVWADWSLDDGTPLDRPRCVGTLCGSDALAERLSAAINAQAAHGAPMLAVDVMGKTYIQASRTFRGRCLNADLRKLGY